MDIKTLPAPALAGLPLRSVADGPAPRSLDSEGPAPAGPKAQSSEEQPRESARLVNEPATSSVSGTRLRVDERTRHIVAQLVDESENVVRQIPPEALLKISAQFQRLEGLLFDQEG